LSPFFSFRADFSTRFLDEPALELPDVVDDETLSNWSGSDDLNSDMLSGALRSVSIRVNYLY